MVDDKVVQYCSPRHIMGFACSYKCDSFSDDSLPRVLPRGCSQRLCAVMYTCCTPVGTATSTTLDTPSYGGYTARLLTVPGAPVTAAPAAKLSSTSPKAAAATSRYIGPSEKRPSKYGETGNCCRGSQRVSVVIGSHTTPAT